MPPISKCPLCGSREVQRVRKDVHFPTRAGTATVPDLEFDHCPKCGENFYDHQASQKIDATLFPRPRTASKRKIA